MSVATAMTNLSERRLIADLWLEDLNFSGMKVVREELFMIMENAFKKASGND